VPWLQHLSEIQRQQSVHDFVCSTLYNPTAVLRHVAIIEVLAACIGNIVFVDTVTPQNERQHSLNTASTERQQSINTMLTKCQQSINAFGCCIMYILQALLRYMSIINVLAAILCNCDRDMVTPPVWTSASTERQGFCVLHLVRSKGCAMAFIHKWSIGSLCRQYGGCQYHYTSEWASTERQHRINRATTEHQHSVNWLSKECQCFGVLHHIYSGGSATAYVHN